MTSFTVEGTYNEVGNKALIGMRTQIQFLQFCHANCFEAVAMCIVNTFCIIWLHVWFHMRITAAENNLDTVLAVVMAMFGKRKRHRPHAELQRLIHWRLTHTNLFWKQSPRVNQNQPWRMLFVAARFSTEPILHQRLSSG